MNKPILSRRDVLKLGSYGLMGLILPDILTSFSQTGPFASLQGCIINGVVWAYDEPDSRFGRSKLYWHDLIVPITNTTLGADEAAYNRIWYQLEDDGYVYSGDIQPVRTLLNKTRPIPTRGALGEVSVPYTDAYLEADDSADYMYRLSYETVHWVAGATETPNGTTW